MKLIPYLLFIALVFGVCFLVDKGFEKIFRSQAQYRSGLAVRLNKRYAVGGLILILLGIVAIITGVPDAMLLWIGGIIIVFTGAGLIAYYLSTGIFYDQDTFLSTSFGKKGQTYSYRDILHQQLYVIQGGSMIIELHLADGSAVQVLSTMAGYREFLNHAFLRWVQMKNIDIRQNGDFHDPDSGCWFPSAEEVL